jgi:hypothetical protein
MPSEFALGARGNGCFAWGRGAVIGNQKEGSLAAAARDDVFVGLRGLGMTGWGQEN